MDHQVSAIVLGAVQAGVGAADDGLGRLAGRKLGDADGNGYGAQYIAGGFLHQLLGFNRLADLAGDAGGGFQAGAAQQNGEFLAAITRRGVAALGVFRQAGRDQAQHLVASLMAPSVVEFLEKIDVAQKKAGFFAMRYGVLGGLHRVIERLVIGDIGQRIGEAFLAHIVQLVAQFSNLGGRGL